ncbi:hypothetical protein [Alicyclobacillus sp. SP_1]|jgi:hypothetical protein|uniref:hypothetical protein n=1 Tax=Alicyclobacillus sp. SP_1 TaxID=2942475 RepID=UPI002157E44B|nr:hypothetical protein [Alicyclobacillus sp. SP_1]
MQKFQGAAKTWQRVVATVFGLVMGLPQTVLAATNGTTTTSSTQSPALAGFYQVLGGHPLTTHGIVGIVGTVIQDVLLVITAIAAGFVVVYGVLAGIEIMRGGGQKRQEGMEKLRYVLFGGIVALSSGLLAGIVGWAASIL